MSDTESQIINGASDIIGGAARGFLTGGPIGALLGAITGILPDIGVHLFGATGPTVVAAVEAAAASVTGVARPTADDVAGLAPDKTAELRVQLAQIAAQAQKDKDTAAAAQMALALAGMQASLADTAGARAMAMSGAGLTKWGAITISSLVMLTFGAVVIGPVVTGRALVDDAGLRQVLYAAVTLVLGFWLGSSSGSQGKDATIANSIPAAVLGGVSRPLVP